MKAIICALAVMLPAALHAETVTIQTATGEVEAEARPGATVALDFAAIDTLSALDVALAARPDFTPPAYLAGALDGLPTVGTLFEPDYEALAAMAPDLIIAGGRSQSQVPQLSKLAPTLDMTIDGAQMIPDAKARISAYGALFDRVEQADALNVQLDDAIVAASDAAQGKGDALILMTNGGKIAAYGASSRFGWLHQVLALPEAYPGLEVESHGEAVSFEFVAEANPDWILVIDRGAAVGQGGEAGAATLDNPLIAGTTAGQKGQIVYLDPAAMYLAGGGYQALMLTLDQLDQAFSGAKS
ncbi:siderophore ABC transporter substrate-binding protein [Paracoccus sp. M683]|uniref:siderophore ABC transporter substrate-binding protein n=1 Tax=Paracoccus sp. M683 TaxID=2594268 RepID=UPI001180CE26|nr:siderophore ABC transporter substrate-binding protein [Paracoccus sp. M683]TRW97745.1 siderophore ABC transporter substrate-binding protein [Paracoccus sp. M683]